MRTRNAKFKGAEGVPGNQMKVTDSVELEVANVIAIGTAVGFDFSEVFQVEEEVLDEITRREEEDLVRFEAISEGLEWRFLSREARRLWRAFCFVSVFKEVSGWVKDVDFGILSSLEYSSVCFVPRDANSMADSLAYRGMALDWENVFWKVFCFCFVGRGRWRLFPLLTLLELFLLCLLFAGAWLAGYHGLLGKGLVAVKL
ncbi:hypothetical protein Q3G72_000737 [Acer saccharum]|nr:hypothetical protein Q3G72_000737 [Acer saccharum]